MHCVLGRGVTLDCRAVLQRSKIRYIERLVSEKTPCEDFADAHDRHWTDAERPFGCPAWANADHLYGLSAECGLKAVLVREGQTIDPLYRLHIDKLWPAFVSLAQGWQGTAYLSMLPPGTPFQDWHINQRYANHRHFDHERVRPHRDATRAVRAVFMAATKAGKP